MRPNTTHKFRLYVAGDSYNSMLARANLASLCRLHLAENFAIELVDVLPSLREPWQMESF